MEAAELREKLYHIRDELFVGNISYDLAKELASPYISEINKRGAEIAKKHGVRPQKVTFQAIMRQENDYGTRGRTTQPA